MMTLTQRERLRNPGVQTANGYRLLEPYKPLGVVPKGARMVPPGEWYHGPTGAASIVAESMTMEQWRARLKKTARWAQRKVEPTQKRMSRNRVGAPYYPVGIPGHGWFKYYVKSGRLVRFGKGAASETVT
jgi:hypothetical protein